MTPCFVAFNILLKLRILSSTGSNLTYLLALNMFQSQQQILHLAANLRGSSSKLCPCFYFSLPIQYIPRCVTLSSFRLKQQQYADDTQLYISVQNSNHDPSLTSIQTCLSALYLWYAKNGLCINPSKSESVLFSKSNRFPSLKGGWIRYYFGLSICNSYLQLFDYTWGQH